MLAGAYWKMGDLERFHKYLQRARERWLDANLQRTKSEFELVMDYAGVGDLDTAFEHLQRMLDMRDPALAVYTHKNPTQFLKQLAGKTIYGADTLELYAIDRELVSALVARLERRVALSLSVSDRELYISIGSDQLAGRIVRLSRDA